MTVVLGIGTVKGAWFAQSTDRRRWTVTGPVLRGWEVGAFGRAPGGDYLVATGSTWYGAAIHRSRDRDRWTQVVAGPSHGDPDRPVDRIWTLERSGDHLYAGVAHAGLFRSDDDGEHWSPVGGLNDHETRPAWQPGLGGLALHHIVIDPQDASRLWVGISAVGVFETTDAGSSWELRNGGVPVAAADSDHDIGYCVHALAADPADASRMWRQDHRGVFRTTDGGRHWERIQNGIPGTGFGFPMRRDPRTGRLFIVPLESDEYRMPPGGDFRVYVSDDDGASWRPSAAGLPDEPSYVGVLRNAVALDGEDPTGVYVGTTAGDVWASRDTGDEWQRLPGRFPRITSLAAFAT